MCKKDHYKHIDPGTDVHLYGVFFSISMAEEGTVTL